MQSDAASVIRSDQAADGSPQGSRRAEEKPSRSGRVAGAGLTHSGSSPSASASAVGAHETATFPGAPRDRSRDTSRRCNGRPAGTPIARCQAGAGACHRSPDLRGRAGRFGPCCAASRILATPRAPRRVHTRAGASPSRFARRSAAVQLSSSLTLRRGSSPRRTGTWLHGPPNVLSRRAPKRSPRSARRSSRSGVGAPATPWPRRATRGHRRARMDSGSAGEPARHRPTIGSHRSRSPIACSRERALRRVRTRRGDQSTREVGPSTRPSRRGITTIGPGRIYVCRFTLVAFRDRHSGGIAPEELAWRALARSVCSRDPSNRVVPRSAVSQSESPHPLPSVSGAHPRNPPGSEIRTLTRPEPRSSPGLVIQPRCSACSRFASGRGRPRALARRGCSTASSSRRRWAARR